MNNFKINTFIQTKIKQKDIPITNEHIILTHNFLKFANTVNNSIGIAMPQCGINKRICVIKINNKWIGAINPRILGVSNESRESIEGCLSWPNKYIKAERYSKIEVEYYDIYQKIIVNKIYDGFNSIIWQHEIDHLDGKIWEIVDKDFRTIKCNIKMGRNDLCMCGSGKKYKKCCGK